LRGLKNSYELHHGIRVKVWSCVLYLHVCFVPTISSNTVVPCNVG
jgi:hypothetical protein